MKSVLAVLSLLAVAVSSAPLVFDSHLLTHGDVHGRLAVLHHVSHVDGPGATHTKLRFLLLVPKLHKLDELREGFASKPLGHDPKPYPTLKFDEHEHLVDLVGLSDCKTWHAVLLKLWTPVGVSHKVLAGVKTDGVFKPEYLTGVPALALFVKNHVTLEHLRGLFDKGVPSHVLTHHVHHLVKDLL